MDKPLAGPLRAFRDRYVASFGGLTYDLAPRSIGVHPDRIGLAPELPGRQVLVQPEGRAPRASSLRPAFRVIVLDRLMRNARELAQRGGIVFSSFDLEDPDVAEMLARLDLGESVFMNAALERLPATGLRRPTA